MTKPISKAVAAKIRKLRETEGLSWSILGERFGISGGAARAAHARPAEPEPSRRWATAATRLGISLEDYTAWRAAGLAHCGRCLKWFAKDGPLYNPGRYACCACAAADTRSRWQRSAPSIAEREGRMKAAKERRTERAAAQGRRLEDELFHTLQMHRETLGPRPSAVRIAALTSYTHVTIRGRLRRLEARGMVAHGADGWQIAPGWVWNDDDGPF
jgi:hypothetical protein